MFCVSKRYLMACVFCMFSVVTHAQTDPQVKVVVIPMAGDEQAEKVIFITKGPITSTNLGGLSGADNLCQSEADAPGSKVKGKTFKAWLAPTSADYLSPVARPFNVFELPYVTPNGDPYSSSYSDMISGSSFPFLSEGADGILLPSHTAYEVILTGRDSSNKSQYNCNEWNAPGTGSGSYAYGFKASHGQPYNSFYTNCTTITQGCSEEGTTCRIVCMEQ